jgi:hypothetical protein
MSLNYSFVFPFPVCHNASDGRTGITHAALSKESSQSHIGGNSLIRFLESIIYESKTWTFNQA